jgi:signal peptidase I
LLVAAGGLAALALYLLRRRGPRELHSPAPARVASSPLQGSPQLDVSLIEPTSSSDAEQESADDGEPASKRRSRRSLIGLAVSFVLVAGWFFFLRPEFLGGPAAYVLVSGNSMLPTLEDGDFVVALGRERYSNGDIVVYRIPAGEVGAGGQVIHRIVGGSAEEGYVLRGDNRTTVDLWQPTPSDIEGKLLLRIPAVGRAVPYLRSPLAVAAFAGVMAFLFIYRSGADDEEEEADQEEADQEEAPASPLSP